MVEMLSLVVGKLYCYHKQMDMDVDKYYYYMDSS
jgi:hypothetical protein